MREQPAEPRPDGANPDTFWGSQAHADIVANLAARARRDLEALTEAGTSVHRALEAGIAAHDDEALRAYREALRAEVHVYAGRADVPARLLDVDL